MMKRCYIFFNDTASTEIYTLSLHDALPICVTRGLYGTPWFWGWIGGGMLAGSAVHLVYRGKTQGWTRPWGGWRDLARSEEHTSELQSANITYAVFCLKKKQCTVIL